MEDTQLPEETKKKVQKLVSFSQDSELAFFDEVQEINDSLKSLSEKTQKVSIEGAEIITIKGEKGDKGDEPSDNRLKELIVPLIPEPLKGEKGDKGEPSTVPGPKGDRGEKGDSVVGPQGVVGPKGEQGDQGPAGSADTPEQVRDKLETLEDEERLDISAIKGFQKTIEDLKSSGKRVTFGGTRPLVIQNSGVIVDKNTRVINFLGAGINSVVRTASGVVNVTISGGGGTTYSETPSGLINGSNTSYTTAHTITTVLNFAINGQYIHPGEYSVAGTTITFVTALDASLSGTSFTITYQ